MANFKFMKDVDANENKSQAPNEDEVNLEVMQMLAGQLKDVNNGWVEDLVKIMKKKNNEINKNSIYNLLNNRVKKLSRRLLFVNSGKELLVKYANDQKKALNGIAETVG